MKEIRITSKKDLNELENIKSIEQKKTPIKITNLSLIRFLIDYYLENEKTKGSVKE